MSFTKDLLLGLTGLVSAGGIADPGFMKVLPTGPDRCYAVTAYTASDEAKVALSHVRVQFWFRGIVNDSLDVDELGDAVFNLLHGIEHVQVGSAHINQMLRVSSIQLGADANKRSERSDNYELDLDVPVTPGRPW